MSQQLARFEKRITVTQNASAAVDVLAEHTPFSKQQIKAAMQKGAVWVTADKKTVRVRRAKRLLKTGEVLQIFYDPFLLQQIAQASSLVADCGRYSVWDKAENVLAQGSQWGDHCALLRFAEQYFEPARPAFLVHRLDREATGLMIIAHDSEAAGKLSALFQSRDIEKHYRITVQGIVTETAFRVEQPLDGKTAISQFTRISVDEAAQQTVLDVSIETGRKHQIRRHIADIGHPVVGDKRYGSPSPDGLQLRAYKLVFRCPLSRKQRQFSLPV